MSLKLTTSVIKQTRPAQKRVVIYDSVIRGLHVVVTPKEKKTFNSPLTKSALDASGVV